jgi:hypothetical protein
MEKLCSHLEREKVIEKVGVTINDGKTRTDRIFSEGNLC